MPNHYALHDNALHFLEKKYKTEKEDREPDKIHWRQEKKIKEREKGKKRRTYPSHHIIRYSVM